MLSFLIDDDHVTSSHTVASHDDHVISNHTHSYVSDFEDHTTIGGQSATDVITKESKKDVSEVTEDISSEGDTLVEQQQQQHSNTLDDTLQDSKTSLSIVLYCLLACGIAHLSAKVSVPKSYSTSSLSIFSFKCFLMHSIHILLGSGTR